MNNLKKNKEFLSGKKLTKIESEIRFEVEIDLTRSINQLSIQFSKIISLKNKLFSCSKRK